MSEIIANATIITEVIANATIITEVIANATIITEVIANATIITGAATLISGVGAKIGLTLYGFSTSGIVVGSSAAAAQAAVGNIAAGSTIALFQSIGMLGMAGLVAPAAIAGAAVGAVYLCTLFC